MADFTSDSGSDYGYDLTTSDEEQVWAAIDELAPASPQNRPAAANSSTHTRNQIASSPFDPNSDPDFDPDASIVEEVVAAITDDDLSFDVTELQEDNDDTYGQGQGTAYVQQSATRNGSPDSYDRRLAPSVAGDDTGLASFVATTKPRPMPTLLPGPDVSYPDLSRALSDAQDVAQSKNVKRNGAVTDNRSPLLRFRTFPMKPFSVSDLTAGSWCELQYYYTLTRLPGGRKTRTAAMKRGTKIHEKLERELFTPVEVVITKKEDNFGLKIWNMIQGLRTLRDQGFTREFEVWGMVEDNLVCGVIDRMSSENPDAELQEDVLSNRGSQAITNSQPYELSTPSDYEIFISDVKTRGSASPPPQPQVRVSLIQLFLYHRFMSDMASDRLDYMRVFERYGLNPDEPFSDGFIAQIGAVHDEVFTEVDAETASMFSDNEAADVDSNAGFVSAPSSPSQLSFGSRAEPTLKYGTLRSLVTLLKFELALTFPRGASDLGKIVAVEYRYRGRESPPPSPTTNTTTDPATNPESEPQPGPEPATEPKPGSVICTHTFFVEPQTLDLYLAETMRWWRGERPPHGVGADEAGFKCRSCEFRDVCEWRAAMDREGLRRAEMKKRAREAGGELGVEPGVEEEGEVGVEAVAVGEGDIEDGGGGVGGKRGGPLKGEGSKRRGRPRKADKEREREMDMDADAEAEAEVEVEVEQRKGAKRGRGRPRKSSPFGGVYA
ncbi:exonuclease V a 5' deoxyribonuclease-domain-containing protein [Chaetomium tenue]|uniref:Exonuclease V a 5' deoxyribonuclease-domain-containing protein n=1 Tax=Chaetomium tenue TaxID=1854479 RepID=A0ACB7P7Q0_9PEZI|nr:exonuclease V a 5' deoxyribonuclease-domain-containing protein [Chaetomium globosum]